MGVTNSKRVYDEEPDEDGKKGKGDKGADASGTGAADSGAADSGAADSGAAGADAAGEEAPAPEAEKDVDKIKAENLRIWSPYYKDFFAFPEARKKLQNVIKNLPEDKYSEKKIKVTEKDFDAYLSDSGPLSEYFKEDLDKSFLSNENTYKSMIGTSIPGDNGTKKLMDLTHIKDDKAKAEMFTKLIPVWVEEMFLPDVKKAVVYDALAKVMKDLIETKDFKAYQKENIIGDKKEDILSGKTSKEEAAIEVKEGNPNAPAAAEPAAEPAAAAAEEKTGGAELDGMVQPDVMVQNGGDDAVRVEAIQVEEGGGDNKKDYKEFKKEQRGDFTEKQTAFFSDTPKLKKFIDENEDSLLDMINAKMMEKITRKKSDKKTDMIAKTFEAINNYVKEPDTEGFAANPPPPPPGAEGEAAGADGAAAGNDGEKKDAKPEEKPAAPPAAPPAATGGATMQEGGAKPSKKKKKKVNRKKKQRKINISINVGNKNSISDSECSDSETSDSSSSSSSSDSSTSDSSTSSSSTSDSSSSSDTSSSSSDTSSSSDSEYERRKKKQKQKKRVRRKRGPKNKK